MAVRNTSNFASGMLFKLSNLIFLFKFLVIKLSIFQAANDGLVKIWDCMKFEGRNVANRSRHTYSRFVLVLSICLKLNYKHIKL